MLTVVTPLRSRLMKKITVGSLMVAVFVAAVAIFVRMQWAEADVRRKSQMFMVSYHADCVAKAELYIKARTSKASVLQFTRLADFHRAEVKYHQWFVDHPWKRDPRRGCPMEPMPLTNDEILKANGMSFKV